MKIITSSVLILVMGAILSSCSNPESYVHGRMGAFNLVQEPVYVVTTSLKENTKLARFDAPPAPVAVAQVSPLRKVAQPPVISQPIALTAPVQKAVVLQAPKPAVAYQSSAQRAVVIRTNAKTATSVSRKKAYPVMPGRGR